jgi:hypothetical protein
VISSGYKITVRDIFISFGCSIARNRRERNNFVPPIFDSS